MKTVLLSIVLLSVIVWGCKNDTVTSVIGPAEQYYELPIGSDSAISHYYRISFTERNGIVTGTSEIIDTNQRHTGSLTGTVNGTSYSLIADFSNDAYDFGFAGTKAQGNIDGQFHFIHRSPSPADTFSAALLHSAAKEFYFDTTQPVNEYIFRPVFITPNPTGPPVVFVHGMTGTLAEWDSLLAKLDAGFKSRHNVYSYQYNWQDSIMINGRILKDSVTSKGLVDPIVIAHSMGGLVSRAYVASGGTVTKLITLGTPHKGTPLANILRFFSQSNLDTPGPKDMKIGGQFITSMLINPLDLANRNKYYCFAGQMGGHFESTSPYWVWNESYYKDVKNGIVCYMWPLLLPYGKNDGLVNTWSAFFEGGGVNLPYPTPQYYVDHMHLVGPAVAPVIFNYINGL